MILIFGKTGQVGCELARHAPDACFLGRDQADLTDPDACAAAILARSPRAVINAAAYTAVDHAETEKDIAKCVNGDAPAAMARACATLGIPIVHISTDYVFDGSGDQPFTPEHPTAPLGVYGHSKLRGEIGVQAAGGVHAILRTSWVFSAHGTNFVKTMLRLGAERKVLRVVDDQIGGPTPAHDIARVCLSIAEQLQDMPEKTGMYHFSGAPNTSWAGFARAIMQIAGLDCVIEGIPSTDYPTAAQRPLNSRLECSSLSTFGVMQPDWRRELEKVINELDGKT